MKIIIQARIKRNLTITIFIFTQRWERNFKCHLLNSQKQNQSNCYKWVFCFESSSGVAHFRFCCIVFLFFFIYFLSHLNEVSALFVFNYLVDLRSISKIRSNAIDNDLCLFFFSFFVLHRTFLLIFIHFDVCNLHYQIISMYNFFQFLDFSFFFDYFRINICYNNKFDHKFTCMLFACCK